jgi:hypothetical protein
VRSGLDVPTFSTRRLHACPYARAPSGGRWNCGREMSGKCCLNADFHVTFRDLLHAVKLRHGSDGFTSPPKEDVLRIFSPKNLTASAGCKPANLGTKGQHANSRPSKPFNTRKQIAPENKSSLKTKLSLCIPGRQMKQWRYCSTYSTLNLIGVRTN